MVGQTMGVLYVALIVFAFILAILWTLLPFAVFGIKAKLDEAITELKALHETMRNRNLDELVRASRTE